MDILQYNTFFLVGVKGVAMTSLAQCLLDARKSVSGSDVDEAFVTQPQLDRLGIHVDTLESSVPNTVECVVYTSAHQGPANPQVQEAKKNGVPCFSQAEALASLFNRKKGVAVCGVGGKSTVSAMITWIFEQENPQSFSVGVGEVIGMEKTGRWSTDSEFFVAEADDYVIDPAAPSKGEEITPRFSYLKPFITVCTNLKFDHPDVYRDFAHTKRVFLDFFYNLQTNGFLIINADDTELMTLAEQFRESRPDVTVLTFGFSKKADLIAENVTVHAQTQQTVLRSEAGDNSVDLKLQLPGKFNVSNAAAAVLATRVAGIKIQAAAHSLASFRSTKRRFEFIGLKNDVWYYDDYAHHPHEIKAVISAIQNWHPNQRVVVGFQSHTYSRTKQLFDEFVEALSTNPEIIMTDIFSSAREKKDDSVSSELLCQAIERQSPQVSARNLKNNHNMANWCRENLHPNDVFITLGAGDIYHVHSIIGV